MDYVWSLLSEGKSEDVLTEIGLDEFAKIADLLFYEDDIIISNPKAKYNGEEGRKIYRLTSSYERNPTARKAAMVACKEKYGKLQCEACGFSFKEKYGSIGESFIEVHHIVPLSIISEKHYIHSDKDLVCLCANCHRMIHRVIKKMECSVSLEDFKTNISSKPIHSELCVENPPSEGSSKHQS